MGLTAVTFDWNQIACVIMPAIYLYTALLNILQLYGLTVGYALCVQ